MIHFGKFGGGSEEVEEMGREVKRGNGMMFSAPFSHYPEQ